MAITPTTLYFAQILKADNKWYYVAMSPFFLTESAALDCARVDASNKKAKDYRATSRVENIDENGCIVD